MATSTWKRPPRSRNAPIPLTPAPQSRLIWTAVIQGIDGNFYGTTSNGGTGREDGSVFMITPGGIISTLYPLLYPDTPLVQGTNGSFYGTLSYGGKPPKGCNFLGCGMVFKFAPGAKHLTVLHNFDGRRGNYWNAPPKTARSTLAWAAALVVVHAANPKLITCRGWFKGL